jgi:hypothetical protein
MIFLHFKNFLLIKALLVMVMIIKYLYNTTNTLLFNDKYGLHVSAYHKPSSGQLFTHSTNYILICVRIMGSHMAYNN